jgi:hypothetical protein
MSVTIAKKGTYRVSSFYYISGTHLVVTNTVIIHEYGRNSDYDKRNIFDKK